MREREREDWGDVETKHIINNIGGERGLIIFRTFINLLKTPTIATYMTLTIVQSCYFDDLSINEFTYEVLKMKMDGLAIEAWLSG